MKTLSKKTIALTFSALVLSMPMASTFAAERVAQEPLVEFEMMTWAEVKSALAAGKTTALIFTGGTEQRGPHLANGGHNLMARGLAKGIALKLGDAIAMPVLPISPNRVRPDLPGGLNLPADLLGRVLEQMAGDAITNGFKNVVLMGDSGGGQGPNGVYATVAKKLDAKYAAKGIHVFYCDEAYRGANAAWTKYITEHNLPVGVHGGLLDTSLMLYLDTGGWVRKELIPTAVGDLVVDGKVQVLPNSPHNGIAGDARPATAELGKIAYDIKVAAAVKQIRSFIPK